MQCQQCGASLDGEASFCDECGHPLHKAKVAVAATLQDAEAHPDAASEAKLLSKQPHLGEFRARVLAAEPAKVRALPEHPGRRGAPRIIISHWSKLIEGFQTSPKAFYTAVQDALDRRITADTEMSYVEWPEGAMFSARRTYLRIRRKDLIFDICAAPFGKGFFVSWWLGEFRRANPLYPIGMLTALSLFAQLAISVANQTNSNISGYALFLFGFALCVHLLGHHTLESVDNLLRFAPIIGPYYETIVHPATYYRTDTASMFHTSVHSAVLEVLDRMMDAKGIRRLSELDRKPIHRDFFPR